MSRTRFDPDRAAFSDRAHAVAQNVIYRALFGETATFESTLLRTGSRNDIFDGELGIDRLVHVSVPDFHGPITFSVQERFQSPKYAWHEDLTITEWNHASDRPGELHKLFADLFVAGCYDPDADRLINAIVVSCFGLKLRLAQRRLRYRRVRTPKRQTFISVGFDDLDRAGLAIMRIPAAGARRAA